MFSWSLTKTYILYLWNKGLKFGKKTQFVRLFTIFFSGDGSTHDLAGNVGWKLIPQNQGLKEPQFITPHLIRHMNPDVKIIVILRDPVERYR